jgi:hypothetical protein
VTAATTANMRRMGLAGIATAAWADTRSRRWAIVAAVGSWIVFSLAAGGGMLQYAPQGWDLPRHAWLTYRSRTPYAMYVLADRWAVVVVPLYVAQAMAVAALAATYVLLATYAKRCGVGRRISGPIGIGGLVVGSLGAAGSGCCFVSLDYLVREELLGWFGVEEVDLEPRGRVRITVRADRHPEVEDLVDALLDLGPSDVRREDAGGFIPRI